MTQKIKTAVIGVGHLGKAHARIYHSLEEADLVAVCDTNEANGRTIAESYGARFTSDFRDLLGEVEAVSVATPTVNHHEITCACLEAGVSVLVEKPISRTLEEADEMIRLAEAKGVVLQVGHIERFNPAFQALQQQLTNPKFFEAHRMGIFTLRSLDIDVVMDLMVHELDIIASLVKSEVVKIEAVGIPILTQKIDLANARLEFADGCIANITASRVAGRTPAQAPRVPAERILLAGLRRTAGRNVQTDSAQSRRGFARNRRARVGSDQTRAAAGRN